MDRKERKVNKPHDILKHMILTEETYNLVQKQNTFVFKVAKDKNKIEIREAVHKAFGARVLSVNSCIAPRKEKGMKGRSRKWGIRPAFKKAYVKIHPEDVSKIPLI